jgi:hypothetical protein
MSGPIGGTAMNAFSYADQGDLFPGLSLSRGKQVSYRRFDTAAEAIRFAIEDLPLALLRGCVLEVNEVRIEGEGIRALYDAMAYPLPRKPAG